MKHKASDILDKDDLDFYKKKPEMMEFGIDHQGRNEMNQVNKSMIVEKSKGIGEIDSAQTYGMISRRNR